MQRVMGLNVGFVTTTAFCAIVSLPLTAWAKDAPYNIPAGDMKTALRAFESATGQRVFTKGLDLRKSKTHGARGAQSAEEALSQVLEGTNLKVCRIGADLKLIATPSACPLGLSGRSSNSAHSHALSEQHETEIIVTGTAVSHLAEKTRTGTRMDADPMSLPLSVSTVKDELIQQRQAITLSDIVSNISGVDTGPSGSITMRGFSANTMRNGNIGAGDNQSNNLPVIAISSVEAVKGPEAIIAGIGAGYGGIINIVSKVPPLNPTGEITATVGTRRYYDIGADVGGPLNEGKNVLIRLVGSTQNTDRTIAGYKGNKSNYLAPSVSVRMPDWGTELIAQYEYQDLRKAPDTIVGTGGTSLTSNLPIRRLSPRGDGLDVKSRLLTLSFEQKITTGVTAALRYSDSRETRTGTNASSFVFNSFIPFPDITTLRFNLQSKGYIKNFKAELRGEFKTGPFQHKILASYDISNSRVSSFSTPLSVLTTNLNTGITTDQTSTLGQIFGFPGPRAGGGQSPKETGILVLDQITWGKIVLLPGVRKMRYEGQLLDGTPLQTFNRLLPSFGAVYRVTPELSLYGNASKGFKPNQGYYDINGKQVPPEDARQFEVGVKALLLDKKLAATLSVYSIHQKNVATANPLYPYPQYLCQGPTSVCYETVSGEKSRGVEVDISGHVLSRLEIRGNYRYADVSVNSAVSSVPFYAPNQGSIWATYSFGENNRGLWASVGVQARDAQKGGNIFTPIVRVPGQVRTDLSVGYDASTWSAIVGMKNLFDKRLYAISSGYWNTGIVDQPREVYATVRYHFW